MAKFLKSFFTTDKKKSGKLEGEEDEGRDFTPPMDGRRNLSISRSGRMRQANKKRSSLTSDLYGEDLQTPSKPKSREYHVNNPIHTADNTRRSLDSTKNENEGEKRIENAGHTRKEDRERIDVDSEASDVVKTPEEEIELAFEIIDKIS